MDKVIVKNLTKKYPGVMALDKINFEINSGCITGFLGPNGAGKTTTMKILAGIISPTAGDCEICGYNLKTNLDEIKKITGYLPESNPLYSEMRVKEYLYFRARIKGLDNRGAKERISQLAEECYLSEFIGSPIRNISKGMRQRVGIADALLHNPKFLIFDEPTIGLDPNQVRDIRNLLKSQSRDKIVFLSTHILSEVESICENVIIIHQGKIVAQGSTREISSTLKISNRIRLQFIGDELSMKYKIEQLDGVKAVILNKKGNQVTFLIELAGTQDLRGEIYNISKNNDVVLLDLGFESLPLEEIFASLTK
ncbi:MAG: ATP-binding cassette domain-containing protein [Planctomycetes bacterium]|nr:ATP-binding cassette domain-containing protein [Planctomycetota bacterium]